MNIEVFNNFCHYGKDLPGKYNHPISKEVFVPGCFPTPFYAENFIDMVHVATSMHIETEFHVKDFGNVWIRLHDKVKKTKVERTGETLEIAMREALSVIFTARWPMEAVALRKSIRRKTERKTH